MYLSLSLPHLIPYIFRVHLFPRGFSLPLIAPRYCVIALFDYWRYISQHVRAYISNRADEMNRIRSNTSFRETKSEAEREYKFFYRRENNRSRAISIYNRTTSLNQRICIPSYQFSTKKRDKKSRRDEESPYLFLLFLSRDTTCAVIFRRFRWYPVIAT